MRRRFVPPVAARAGGSTQGEYTQVLFTQAPPLALAIPDDDETSEVGKVADPVDPPRPNKDSPGTAKPPAALPGSLDEDVDRFLTQAVVRARSPVADIDAAAPESQLLTQAMVPPLPATASEAGVGAEAQKASPQLTPRASSPAPEVKAASPVAPGPRSPTEGIGAAAKPPPFASPRLDEPAAPTAPPQPPPVLELLTQAHAVLDAVEADARGPSAGPAVSDGSPTEAEDMVPAAKRQRGLRPEDRGDDVQAGAGAGVAPVQAPVAAPATCPVPASPVPAPAPAVQPIPLGPLPALTLAHARSRSTTYDYAKLADLQVSVSTNVYGVLKAFTGPKPTRVGSWVCTMTVMDASCPAGVSVNFFGGRDHLPSAVGIGDVVRLHRMDVSTFNGALQLCSSPRASSMLVIRASGDVVSTSKTFSVVDEDLVAVRELRAWAHTHLPVTPVVSSAYGTTIEAVLYGHPTDTYFDLCCCVAQVEHLPPPPGLPTGRSPPSPGVRAVWVWDGTGHRAPGNTVPPPPCADATSAVGGLVHLLLKEASAQLRFGALKAKPGDWLLLRNVMGRGTQVFFKEASFGSIMPLFAKDVVDRLEVYTETAARGPKWVPARGVQPQSCPPVPRLMPPVPVSHIVAHSDLPVTSLQNVLNCTELPNKFRVQCRVSAVWPPQVERCVVSSGPSPADWSYFFTLCLDDGSGMLTAIAHGAEAAALLPGLPPVDCSRNPVVANMLAAKFETLLRPQSVFECVLLAYVTPPQASRARETVNFAVHSTVLL